MNVFGSLSKLASVSLEMETKATDLETVFRELYFKPVYVNYPIQQLALVVSVSDHSRMLPSAPQEMLENYAAAVQMHYTNMEQYFKNFKNIEVVPQLQVLVHAFPLRCLKKTSQGKFVPEWEPRDKVYPLELVMQTRDNRHHMEGLNPSSLEDEFPRGSQVIILSQEHYGSLGTVVGYCPDDSCPAGGLEVQVDKQPLDILESCTAVVRDNADGSFITLTEASAQLECPKGMLNLLTGNFRIRVWTPGQVRTLQIGLNLRNDRTTEHVQGWARWGNPSDPTCKEWQISHRAVEAVQRLKQGFPAAWENLLHFNWTMRRRDLIDFRDLFNYAEAPEKEAERMALWAMKEPSNKLPWVPSNSDKVSDSALAQLEGLPCQARQVEPTRLQLNPGLVYRPSEVWTPVFSNEASKFRLGDRVVNLSSCHARVSVPLGAEGTVVATYGTQYIEVLFDALLHHRGPVLVDPVCVLNLSLRTVHALRTEHDIMPYMQYQPKFEDLTIPEDVRVPPSYNLLQSKDQGS